MPNERGKSLDKTYLSIDNAESRLFLHRDYIAHCLRWSHIVKYLNQQNRYKTASVLDLGCGKEAPLIKTLYSSRMLPYWYTGVDAGSIEPSIDFSKFPDNVQFLPNTDIYSVQTPDQFNVVVMLEVLEHMEKDYGSMILEKVASLMNKDSVLFLSTPCFNGSKAANHVYEWAYQELKDELVKHFVIKGNWGTFASIKDYEESIAAKGLYSVFAQLREYYDSNVLACLFAPLFPDQSRNCLWQLTK